MPGTSMYGEPFGAVLAPTPTLVDPAVPVDVPNEPPPIVPEKPGVVYGDANVVMVVTRLLGTV
jgi:hypothetical protein